MTSHANTFCINNKLVIFRNYHLHMFEGVRTLGKYHCTLLRKSNFGILSSSILIIKHKILQQRRLFDKYFNYNLYINFNNNVVDV